MFKLIGFLLLIVSVYFVSSCKIDTPIPPSITTTSVTDLTYTTAVSGGNLTQVGSSPLLQMGLCWSISPEPTIEDKYTTEDLDDVSFSTNLTQLTPNTEYFIRAYATNSDGIGYGNQVTCKTSQIASPTLTTSEITQLNSTTATSGGNILSDNGGLVTSRGVCWGTALNPTVDDNKTTDGDGTGTFISSIVGLIPSTTYYVRAYATNTTGTAYGNQQTFRTPYDVMLDKENFILSGGSIISTFDGGHIIFGYSYKNIPNSTLIDWIPYIIKLDAFGNRIWETEVSIHFITNYKYSDILETKDHNIVFCYKSNVVMLDANGNILWQFEYKTDERYGCSSLVETDENDLFVLASDELRTALVKISIDGKLLWDKIIKDGDDVNTNVGHLLCEIDNGNYFLAGFANIDFHWRIWVAEINSTGEIVWENIFIDNYELSLCTDMAKTSDGGVIITGYSVGMLNETYARVYKLDAQHKLMWEKSYAWDGFSNKGYAIIQNSNGDFVFCGTQGYQKVKAVLVKLNKDGNDLWKRTFWPAGSLDFIYFLGGLQQIGDGGYILVGTKRTLWGTGTPEGIWVKKVDENGY